MLELSCADYTFPLLGRREALAVIRLLQFDFLDLGLFERNPNYPPSALNAAPRQFIDGVRSDLEAAALGPADVFLQTGLNPEQASANDPDEKVRSAGRDTFYRALELCTAIQCNHITGLPGVAHGDQIADLARAAEEACWRVETGAKAGIIYSIEPHVGSICGDTRSTHTLLAQVPGLTLTLDYGHFIVQGESNAAIHTLLPYASHIHLRGAAPGRLQTPAAESTIDISHILRNCANYSGKFALEYVWSDWHDCNRTDNLSETILLRRQLTQLEANLNATGCLNIQEIPR
jgi:sugar phosphate isomerase/epimerase